MAFVNEFVSEEDVSSHDLEGLLNRYRQYPWEKLPRAGFRYSWTMDGARGVFLVLAKILQETGASGLHEPTNRRIFVLSWRGDVIEVELEKSRDSTIKFNAAPFRIIWELRRMTPNELPAASHDEIVAVLKEALTAFGLDGANLQVPNTIVEFRF